MSYREWSAVKIYAMVTGSEAKPARRARPLIADIVFLMMFRCGGRRFVVLRWVVVIEKIQMNRRFMSL